MLEIEGLRAGYGPINVLWDVSLRAEQGKTTVLLGPNGAGKTTLLRAVMGLVGSTRGDVRLEGRSIRGAATASLAAAGLVLVPEGRMAFGDMPVEENLILGAYAHRGRVDLRGELARVYGLFPRLEQRRRQLAGTLSGGELQMLAIGRGLMQQPRVLLIDEPSLGLAPVVIDEVYRIVGELRRRGLTILLVEQHVARALGVADRVFVVRSGRVVHSGDPGTVDRSALEDAYFAAAPG